ncbi:MAG: hypothetical protein M5U12_10410 [Verrucomicrobia bacterium]|nr:hypothetical protein [Verrucomicrobiota bacterium]
MKVAVPVSGMSDLEDYVGAKVVNGHCDCMFALNTFQWPWTQIAALIAPRPLLFANSGHDPIFPMDGNDRIRARLERLYGFYTNRTESLFDIAVTPGGHDDKPELRLMAYRWIAWHLQGTNAPVTEPALPPIEGNQLRVFPGELPADELNTTIDESFVPMATRALPGTAGDFQVWRADRLAELRRLVFRPLPQRFEAAHRTALGNDRASGVLVVEPGLAVSWKYFPPASGASDQKRWLLVLGEQDSWNPNPTGPGGWPATRVCYWWRRGARGRWRGRTRRPSMSSARWRCWGARWKGTGCVMCSVSPPRSFRFLRSGMASTGALPGRGGPA